MDIETTPPKEATEEDTAIWRYMDLPKFISMLATKTLWFAKAATLEDAYEGFCLVRAPDIPVDEHGPRWLTKSGLSEIRENITLGRMVAELGKAAADYLEDAREHLYVNSWCLADESMAMWEIYGSIGRGIAVRSSLRRYELAGTFTTPYLFDFGKVSYHDDIT